LQPDLFHGDGLLADATRRRAQDEVILPALRYFRRKINGPGTPAEITSRRLARSDEARIGGIAEVWQKFPAK